MRLRQIPAIMILIGSMLAGCNLANNNGQSNGPQAVFTAAARTLEAQLTQVIVLPPTDTAVPPTDVVSPAGTQPPETVQPGTRPTLTAGGTQDCDAARFVADVTIPDGTQLTGSQGFTKTWRFMNTGSCTWSSSYSLVFDTGDAMGGPASIPLPGNVAPGQPVDVSVSLQAPADPGSYRGYWRLRNLSGAFLPVANGYKNKSVYVDIQVKNAGKNLNFAVTKVEFNVTHSGTCSSGTYTVTAKVTANSSGEVSYTWERSDGVDGPLNKGRLSFASAGTQTVSYDWASGATGLSMTLYIDSPNHQNFGTALLNCP